MKHDVRNDLLKRREVVMEIESDKNPGIAHSTKLIADHFKAGEDHVALKSIQSSFGRKTFLINAFVYDSLKEKQRVEQKVKVKVAKV
ncbi:hypothetical protein KW787_04210 [Candidatus Pacearchaeota archaeon]|nr:hypothetical protein [Candidatus Pacearchaeota archaeon]